MLLSVVVGVQQVLMPPVRAGDDVAAGNEPFASGTLHWRTRDT